MGEDARSRAVVARLGEVMRLGGITDAPDLGMIGVSNSVEQWQISSESPSHIAVRMPRPQDDGDAMAVHLLILATASSLAALFQGGFLLHSALAERDGQGFLLAGPSGVGKTTSSLRLPSPWRSLSDDATLVVRDHQGGYWAHPWPTWSRFMFGGPGGRWEVEAAVPLRGIFFLEQTPEDRIEHVGDGHAATLLFELAEQLVSVLNHSLETRQQRTLRLLRFDNVCALAKAVPAHRLHLSLTGAFWEEIERVLDGDRTP